MARKRGAVGNGKAKALVPPMKGATVPPPAPPPRAMRGRVALAIPVLRATPTRGRPGLPPPPPAGRMPPPRPMPPGAAMGPATPRAERLVPPPMPPSARSPVMRQRGARQTMAAMRRGAVPF